MTRARDLSNLIGSGNYSQTTLTATAGQTSFTVSHTPNFVQVFMNGLLLDPTVDFTANGTAIVLTEAAAVGDELEVVTYETFSVGDAITQTAADTRYVLDTADAITVSGSNVGIGTSSPVMQLQSAGGIAVSSDPSLTQVSRLYEYFGLQIDSGDAVGNTRPIIFRTGGTERMRIDSSGNVGIGESDPDTSLDVVGGSADSVIDTLTLKNDSTGTSAGIGINFVVDGNNDVTTAAIYGQRTGSAYHQGSLQFLTTDGSGGGLTERMRIDSSGRVTMPYQPAFSAGHNANAFNTSSGSAQVIYNHKMFDIGNNYNTSNGRFTAPVSGTYVFTHTATSRQASSIVFEVKVYQNGTERKRQFSKGPNDAHGTSTTVMLYCSAGDYIESWGYWGTGVNLSGNLDINASASQGTASSFSGHLVG